MNTSHIKNAQQLAVLGGTGFVGKTIVRKLSKLPRFNVTGFSSRHADLTKLNNALSLREKIRPGSILIVSSAITPDRGQPLNAMLDNIKIASNLAALIERHDLLHIIYLSTVDVYGRENLGLPLSEESRVQPSSYYAISKYASEMILKKACDNKGIIFTILRLPGVYGAGDTHIKSPIRVFITSMLKGQVINIRGDGSQLRDFLFVEDIPRLIKEVISKRLSGTYNAVTGKSHSINQVLNLIEELSGKKFKRISEKENKDMLNLVFKKSALLGHLTGFKFTDLAIGLKKYLGQSLKTHVKD